MSKSKAERAEDIYNKLAPDWRGIPTKGKSVMTLAQVKKDINAYVKLVKKEHAMWDKRCKMHKKELLRLAEVYIKLKEKA